MTTNGIRTNLPILFFILIILMFLSILYWFHRQHSPTLSYITFYTLGEKTRKKVNFSFQMTNQLFTCALIFSKWFFCDIRRDVNDLSWLSAHRDWGKLSSGCFLTYFSRKQNYFSLGTCFFRPSLFHEK